MVYLLWIGVMIFTKTKYIFFLPVRKARRYDYSLLLFILDYLQLCKMGPYKL